MSSPQFAHEVYKGDLHLCHSAGWRTTPEGPPFYGHLFVRGGNAGLWGRLQPWSPHHECALYRESLRVPPSQARNSPKQFTESLRQRLLLGPSPSLYACSMRHEHCEGLQQRSLRLVIPLGLRLCRTPAVPPCVRPQMRTHQPLQGFRIDEEPRVVFTALFQSLPFGLCCCFPGLVRDAFTLDPLTGLHRHRPKSDVLQRHNASIIISDTVFIRDNIFIFECLHLSP